MANPMVSLAYYVHEARMHGVPKEALTSGTGYREVLGGREEEAVRAWECFFPQDPLARLEDIEVGQADFLDVVDQVYRGVRFLDVRASAAEVKAPVARHEPYFPQYIGILQGKEPKDRLTEGAVEATMGRVEELLAGKAGESPRVNGLIVGRVQSGKTRNYVGLMLKAADEGWNVILVLTSAIRMLARQTQERIRSEFRRVGANRPRCSGELDFLRGERLEAAHREDLEDDYFYWGVAMKQVDGLARIRAWLEQEGQPHESMRVMIIDDESDNATPNANIDGYQPLQDEEIEGRIQVIRREGGYEALADWFERLLRRRWPQEGQAAPEAFTRICSILQHRVFRNAAQEQGQLLNTAEYRRYLDMEREEFNLPNQPPLHQLAASYFHKKTGDGDRSCPAFVLLLRSIMEIDRERTTINGAICSLVGPNPQTGRPDFAFGRCAYLGYTATPYANILNEGPNETPIYADFIQSLAVPPQYFGSEALFGFDVEKEAAAMPIVSYIADEEEERILAPLRERGSLEGVDDDLQVHDGDGPLEWKSLRDAVAWAFCTAAVRRILRRRMGADEGKERLEHRWTTMLLNVDYQQSVHWAVKNKLERYVRRQLRDYGPRAQFEAHCRAVWTRMTGQFSRERFDELFNRHAKAEGNYGAIEDYPAWAEVEKELQHFTRYWQRCVHFIALNSTPDGIQNQMLYTQDDERRESGQRQVPELADDHLWFVSGGNTIGRGLTLQGLTVSYFDRVRDGTSVDTLTQMGRWFGYRAGYELLPRLWMNRGAVGEMKRIALVESKLHESIRENFEQGFSPSDPAHYQQITSWGRQLSGRAYAAQRQEAAIGTTGSVDDYAGDEKTRREVFGACSRFVGGLGEERRREAGEYTYADTPLWEGVGRTRVLDFLRSIAPLQPPRSAQLLRGLIRAIGEDHSDWDVVVGHPTPAAGEIEFGGRMTRFGAPEARAVGDGVFRTLTARLHSSFYAMVPAKCLHEEDTHLLETFRHTVEQALETKRLQNGGVLPAHYDEALPGDAGEGTGARLEKLIRRMREEQYARPLPEAIHARLADVSPGFRNRASGEYMASAYQRCAQMRGEAMRPVLQLYLIRPRGESAGTTPLVNLSFYWPNHDPVGFYAVAIDGNAYPQRPVTPGMFHQVVEDILRAHNRPMSAKTLKTQVFQRLGTRCTEAFFRAHIGQPPAPYEYHPVAGMNAFCIDGWAADDQDYDKLETELVQCAEAILKESGSAMVWSKLLEAVTAKRPEFGELFSEDQFKEVIRASAANPEGHIRRTTSTSVKVQYRE